MKHETNQMEDPEDRSDWEKRPLRFPIRDEGDVVLRKVGSLLQNSSIPTNQELQSVNNLHVFTDKSDSE